MKTESIVANAKLAFWEVIVRTFIYAFDNKKLFYRAAVFWSVLILDEIVSGFPLFSSSSSGGGFFLSFLTYSVAVSSISIFVFRYILLGENKKGINLSFGKREFCYFAYFSSMLMIMFLPIFIFLISVYYIYQNNSADIFEALFMVLVLFFFYAGYARINLIFPSIALGEKVDIKKAFILTKGNSLRIFLIFLVISFLYGAVCLSSLNALSLLSMPEILSNIMQTILFTFFIYLYAFIYAVLFAHIYKNLHYQKNERL